MFDTQRLFISGFLLGLMALSSACVIAGPHEGYYDHSQHRYYHENAWHTCGDQDEHCR